MKGGLSTSHEGPVLNVVVEQERVVVHLEHGSRGEDVLEAAADARHVAMHRDGRNPLPSRRGYSSIGRTGSASIGSEG